MLENIPKSESLKDTLARSSVYWNEVLVPALQERKSLLVIGHENNLRSLLMLLEDISPKDIIELNLPRAVPLAYRLDLESMKPLDRPDGKLDEATGMLRGEWIGSSDTVKKIMDRDFRQVYDTSVTVNLETTSTSDGLNLHRKQWATLVQSVSADTAASDVQASRDMTKPGLSGRGDELSRQQDEFFAPTVVAPAVTEIDYHFSELHAGKSPKKNQTELINGHHLNESMSASVGSQAAA